MVKYFLNRLNESGNVSRLIKILKFKIWEFSSRRSFLIFMPSSSLSLIKKEKISWIRTSKSLKLGQLVANKSEDLRSGASGSEGNERSWTEIVRGPPRVQQ